MIKKKTPGQPAKSQTTKAVEVKGVSSKKSKDENKQIIYFNRI